MQSKIRLTEFTTKQEKLMYSPRRETKRSKTALIILIVFAVTVMALSVFLVVKLQSDELWFNFDENNINNPVQSGFLVSPVEANALYPFGNGILKVSKDRISILDISGNEIFGEAVSMEAPLCSINGNMALIIDTGSYFFATIDTSRNFKTFSASGALDFGVIGNDGSIVLLTDEPGVKGVAQVLNSAGQGVFTWKSAQSGYILSGSITSDSKNVDFCIANTDASLIQPMLRRFSMEGEPVAQFIPDSNELLPLIIYDSAQDPVMIGQTTMVAFKGSGEKYNLRFNRIYTAASSSSGVLVVAKEKSNEIPSLYIVGTNGEYKKIITLSEDVTPIAVRGNYAAIGYGNTVVLVSISKGEEISRNSLSAAAIRVGFFENSNNIIAVARDGVTTFSLN